MDIIMNKLNILVYADKILIREFDL